MKHVVLAAALLLPLPAAAAAQASPGVAAARASWQQMAGYITRAAEQMPEGDYAYRPVATVRTFGQMVAHVAGSQRYYCAAVLGDPAPDEDAIEKAASTKALLVTAMKESSAYCDRAYALTDAQAAAPASGAGGSKLRALVDNAAHDAEHYGNLVTYLRMKGMVPPSSQPRR